MKYQDNYIMRDQVHNLIPNLMSYDVTTGNFHSDIQIHLIAVGMVTAVYLLAMVFSG